MIVGRIDFRNCVAGSWDYFEETELREKGDLHCAKLDIDFLARKVKALEKELSEKDAMINWLASVLQAIDNRPGTTTTKAQWIKLAQEAVKNNDR